MLLGVLWNVVLFIFASGLLVFGLFFEIILVQLHNRYLKGELSEVDQKFFNAIVNKDKSVMNQEERDINNFIFWLKAVLVGLAVLIYLLVF